MTVAVTDLLEVERGVEIGQTPEVTGASGLDVASLEGLSGQPRGEALGRLGIQLCRQERYAEAAEVLRAAVTMSPGDPLPLNTLAVVLERSGQTPGAIACVERSLALSPGQVDSWLFLGNLKWKLGDVAGAQVAYEAVVAREANSPLAWQGLGLIKRTERKYREAIECFRNCIRQNYAPAPVLSILGQLFYEIGQFEKSRDAYAAAVEGDGENPVYHRMARETQFICAMIGAEGMDDALNAYLRDQSAFPAAGDQDVCRLLETTFSLLSAYGHMEAAKRLGAARVEMFPASASAAYLLHAVAGDASVVRSPEAYIVEHFDEFADRFDERLIQTLGYDLPRFMSALLAGLLPAGARFDVLDMGCGTGLCGQWVRDFSASLTGVDLSSRMLHHAHRRDVYDRLVCSELTEFMAGTPAGFDIAIAADVMIYFGDLAPLAAAIARTVRPGGLIAFSTECSGGTAYRLLSSGRFAHAPEYVRAVFGRDFIPCLEQDVAIRLEAAKPVGGNIFVFRRR